MSDDKMDVDDALLPPISLSQSSPMSSSSLPLPQAEVDKFKKEMILASEWENWSTRLIGAEGDKKRVFLSVLSHCWKIVLSQTALKMSLIDLSNAKDIVQLVESLNDDEVEEWRNLIEKGDWVGVITHWKLQKPTGAKQITTYTNERLSKAYTQTFIGNSAKEFIEHLEQADKGQLPLYAKAIPVIQSSGTGKSRMLTEVGNEIFTLPICLRKPNDPGYPPGDKPVVDFFSVLRQNNDLSVTAHIAIASFLAAAHQMMLETLQNAYNDNLNGPQLLQYWHEYMESTGRRDRREAFFTEVVRRADLMKRKINVRTQWQANPIRGKDGNPPPGFEPFEMSRMLYKVDAEMATQKLMRFVSCVLPEKTISIMYFDEAHKLGSHLPIFLRLVQHQQKSTKMWYTFMGTKSSISYYTPPPPSKMHSLRLKEEVARLPKPYIDLGFDQLAIHKSEALSVRMGEMETIKFISKYGRPMWSALGEEKPGEMIDLASLKLLNGEDFRATNKDHVFAVLSQRLCLDLVMAASEAMALADRSVAHHMRLLTGFSTNFDGFYTHSPSEPVLVMGSIDILYKTPGLLGEVLNTLSKDLCGAGLVEKGILGEFGARTLLLIARDFATLLHSSNDDRNFLKPVRLLDFLHTLLGKDIFSSDDKPRFNKAFGKAYVNFTHWISTRDSIPEKHDWKLLANLWARGAALQCCFSQESIELLIPVYHGSVSPDSNFDPSQLSAVPAQIKYKADGDIAAELAIRPIGVVRDDNEPLPYLAILMELGNKRCFKGTESKIKYKASKPLADGEFRTLCDKLKQAEKQYETRRNSKKSWKADLNKYKKKVTDARYAVDLCNRYSISVRGISPDEYPILREANIVQQFATLLSTVMPSDGEEHGTRKHMRPLERLEEPSHIAWMSDYYVPQEDEGHMSNSDVSHEDESHMSDSGVSHDNTHNRKPI